MIPFIFKFIQYLMKIFIKGETYSKEHPLSSSINTNEPDCLKQPDPLFTIFTKI